MARFDPDFNVAEYFAMKEDIENSGPHAAEVQYQRDYSKLVVEMIAGHCDGHEEFCEAVGLVAAHMSTSAIISMAGTAEFSDKDAQRMSVAFILFVRDRLIANLKSIATGQGKATHYYVVDGKLIHEIEVVEDE